MTWYRLGEVMRDGMFVFYGKGYNQTYDTTLNMDLDITQKLDFVTPGLSVSVKGAYDNQFKLYKERAGGAIESQTVYYQSYFRLEREYAPDRSRLRQDTYLSYLPAAILR